MLQIDRNARRRGRAVLERLLPLAQAKAAAEPPPLEEVQLSEVARVQMQYIRPDNLEAVVIHPAALGGWSCDILLKSVPAGVSNVFGTPSNSPHRTEEEAEASALPLLAFVLAAAAAVQAEPPKGRVFDYFGFAMPLPERGLRFMEEATAENPNLRYGSGERARERLDEITAKLFPGDRVDEETLNRLSREQLAELLVVLSMAALEGMFRYPDWPAKPPKPEGSA